MQRREKSWPKLGAAHFKDALQAKGSHRLRFLLSAVHSLAGSLGVLPLILVIVMAVLTAAFMTIRLSAFFQRPVIYDDPRLLNLTKQGLLWDVYYGLSPECGALPCHLTPDYPETFFQKKMVLPAREFPLNDYKVGQKIYLRTTLTLPPGFGDRHETIAIHSFYIWAKKYRFYINETLMEEGAAETLNITIPKSMLTSAGQVRLAVYIDPGELSYQGLSNRYDLIVGPKVSLKETAFILRESKTIYYLWFMLPKMVFCIIFALVYLIVSRSTVVFLFVSYAFVGAFGYLLRSAFGVELFSASSYLQFGADLCSGIGDVILIGFYYERAGGGKNRTMRLVVLGAAALIFSAGMLHFMVSPSVSVKFLDIFHAVFYPAAFVVGWQKARGNATSKLDLFLSRFLLISVAPALGESWLLISDILGLNVHTGVPITALHDLIMFFFMTALAIVDVSRSLVKKAIVERELAGMNEKLDLARTVQGMLLPASLRGEVGSFAYQYFYNPAEKMSGDWLNVWQTPTYTHLFIGDVVGKGPQAALGVAVVASVIMECRQRQTSIDECIVTLNARLLALFDRNVTTTISVISFTQDGLIELRNLGALGWIIVKGQDVRYQLMRSMPLGMAPEITLIKKEIPFEPDMRILTFTDGCLEGSRAMKHLFARLRTLQTSWRDCDVYPQVILEIGKEHVLEDDKTVLVVSTKPSNF